MKQKWCTKCKILKEWNDFSSMKKDPTKKNSWCKKCEDDKNKKWAEKNPEKVKELICRAERFDPTSFATPRL